jgi:exodeoxyribonuclease VII small subunit
MAQSKKSSLSYQEMTTELEAIMLEMQNDSLDIDVALVQYERGLELVQEIESYLNTAENKIIELKAKFSQDI